MRIIAYGFAISMSISIGALASCSLVEPRAGVLLPSCGSEGGAGAGGYGSGYAVASSAAPSTTSAAATCAPDSGSACDRCESANCCSTRIACLDDPLCACADGELDECLEDEGDAGSVSAALCWNVFSPVGALEQARVECLRTACKDACGVP